MLGTITEQVMAKIHETSAADCRLVLLVGPDDAANTKVLKAIKEKTNAPLVNVSEGLSERLLGFGERQRIAYVPRFLDDILRRLDSDLILLDQTHILFDAFLRQDPVGLFQKVAKTWQVVATWPGVIQEGYLTYSTPGNLDYRSYPLDDLVYVEMVQEK